MKPKHFLFTICVSLFIFFSLSNAQQNPRRYKEWNGTYEGLIYDPYGSIWLAPWYDAWSREYLGQLRRWRISRIQAWNENMQKSIKRLNTSPVKIGITPINGALVLAENDIMLPAREKFLPVTRTYNSKIWYAESVWVDEGESRVRAYSHLGMGWDIHSGMLWVPNDSGKIFEAPNGLRTYFKKQSGASYIATDGSFARIENDTLKMIDGTVVTFTLRLDINGEVQYYCVDKIVDNNGNVTSFHYNESYVELGLTGELYLLDSITTSTNNKAFLHYQYIEPWFHLLDSITYHSFDSTSTKIAYHYYEEASIDTAPWGGNFYNELGTADWTPDERCRPTYLLKSVIYPNNDSVYYNYNDVYELTSIHTAGGDSIAYEYETFNYYIPNIAVYLPDSQVSSETDWTQHYTRGITRSISAGPWVSTDTTAYSRVFRDFTNDGGHWYTITNPDSVTVTYPEGNYTIARLRGGYRHYDGGWGIVKGLNYMGILDSVNYYNKNDEVLRKRRYGPAVIKRITADSISVLSYSKVNNLLQTYQTRYKNYDNYGHPRVIYVLGDTSTTADDYFVHRKYKGKLYEYDTIAVLEMEFSGSSPNYFADISFSCKDGADSLIVRRRWFGAGTTDSILKKTYSPPCYEDDSSYQLKPYPGGQRYVQIWASVWYDGDSLGVYWSLDLGTDPPEYYNIGDDEPCLADSDIDYSEKYIYSSLTETRITSDSTGNDTLSLVRYFYDDTSYIVRNYSVKSPAQWETPPSPSNLRGNITRIEQWKGGSDFTKTEFRYDQIGNIVMAIEHASTNSAETTFTYFDPPSDSQDKYQYGFPWRTVVKPSSGDSIWARTEYDIATGLVIREVDGSNSDSTRFSYDDVNRLKYVWRPNDNLSSKRLTYTKYQSSPTQKPMAVLDSTQQDNDWIISKTFFDGFGKIIQNQVIDENDSVVVQNISYNGNGSRDSTCNPYRIYATSLEYVTPSWSQVTSYEYDGLNRLTKIINPDAESIMIKHYANTDTVFDQKGNRNIYVYNAHGDITTVINALTDTTLYQYDTLQQLTKLTDSEGKEIKYYYDKLGRLIAMNGPDAKSSYSLSGDSVDVLYEYDDVGNLTRKRDANDTVDYSYDDIYRLTKVKHSGGDSIRLIYDTYYYIAGEPNNSKGRLSKIVKAGTDSMVYYYDDPGNLARKDIWLTGLSGKKFLKYKYNDADQCTLMTVYPGSYNTYYHYDKLARFKEIPNLVDEFKYTPSSQIKRIEYANDIIDTISYDNRLRPTRIKAYKSLSTYLDLGYYYQTNSNIDSIIDNKTAAFKQVYTYDSLNRLIKVKLPSAFPAADSQWFSYDKIGNRAAKNGTNYSYYSNTNRLYIDHQSHYYDYDDNGNIIRHRTGQSTIDSLIYDWNNRLIRYKKGDDTLAFAYNASGLRVKKHYHEEDEGGDKGRLFLDSSDDLGIKSTGIDSTYNKGRDIEKIYVKNTANYLTFTIVNKHLFSTANKLKLFITLDLDTIVNSGNISLPEDSLTKVPAKAAWEYCVYISDNDYGFYKKDGAKVSKPFGIAVQKVTGDTGSVQIKISRQLLNHVPAIRYTISTFDPNSSNGDSLWQGGSSAADVYPGTNATFGGEINGYGEITPLGGRGINDYTIYYVYDGINPIVEYSPNGSILARYIYAGGLHIAKIAGADTMWYHCDALGSPRVMTNESAVIEWQARYWPFGEMTESGFADNTHGFTGKEWDSEMSLNYFCQRYYDPEIGRFITLDTWTQLPDDERLFSYEKYARWNSHQLKCALLTTGDIYQYSGEIRNHNFAYDTLASALVSLFVQPSFLLGDRSTNIYSNRLENTWVKAYRYIAYKHQVNRYVYCTNNPLRYIDPTGHLILEMLAIEVAAGFCLGVALNDLYNSLDAGYGYRFDLGNGLGLWLYKDYEGQRRIYFGPIGGGGT